MRQEKQVKSIGIAHFYDFYSREFYKTERGKRPIVNKKSKYYVSKDTYCHIVGEFNKAVVQEIIYDNFEFILPCRMGTLSIVKIKLKPIADRRTGKVWYKFPVNWKATNELWKNDEEARASKKIVRFLNEHTNGYLCKWKYFKNKAAYKWNTVYSLQMCKQSKKELGKFLKDPTKEVNYFTYNNRRNYV